MECARRRCVAQLGCILESSLRSRKNAIRGVSARYASRSQFSEGSPTVRNAARADMGPQLGEIDDTRPLRFMTRPARASAIAKAVLRAIGERSADRQASRHVYQQRRIPKRPADRAGDVWRCDVVPGPSDPLHSLSRLDGVLRVRTPRCRRRGRSHSLYLPQSSRIKSATASHRQTVG